jgi:3-phosphoshikimate 1-carboxyvinyltransferase
MPLPDLIEIVPLTAPVRAEITVPGSKSITNRALVLAALADGETTLTGALWSEDTQVMVECLQDLGFMVNVADDPAEVCNKTITVYGRGGVIPGGGTAENPIELFVGNAGTAARFLAAMVCLGSGVYRLSGVPRMHERPQAALFAALRELGYRVDSANDKLPATISQRSAVGGQRSERTCTVSIEQSSQFASALLLCAGHGGWSVKITGENAEESPYVAMTTKLIEAFPKRGGTFQIEPDASSGSYFWAASGDKEMLQNIATPKSKQPATGLSTTFSPDEKNIIGHEFKFEEFRIKAVEPSKNPVLKTGSDITVSAWPKLGMQVDTRFQGFLVYMACGEIVRWTSGTISRLTGLGDSIMTAIVTAPFKRIPWKFTDLARLRVQECERVVALRTELTKCGAKVVEEGDTLTVYPSQLHGAEIETYHDHRMAMCFAILGLKVPGIKLQNPACVKKTFPNFFQKLAAQPPHGLGAEIWEIKDGQRTRKLAGADLFAD